MHTRADHDPGGHKDGDSLKALGENAAMKIKLDNYEIDILISGFPGRSLYHGGMGWSTIALLRGHGKVIVLDGGGVSMRRLLIGGLAERGVKPGDVTDLLLTHAHHDHLINWTLFRHARIAIGKRELDYALQVPWGESPVPELYAQELKKWPTVRTVEDGEEVLPDISAHLAPGHTPGHLIFVTHGADRDVIFTGDAAKNRAELVSSTTDMTYDAAVSAVSIDMIRELWRSRPGSIVIPGHDLPLALENGNYRYLVERQAAIKAWYGDDMETVTRFELTAK
jgi:glyoxylase-like metal-dependent hydrolase (beta-lactamase superfamily II)